MIQYREFKMTDYDAVLALWKASPGVQLSAADSRENIQKLVERNPGLCFIAEKDGLLIGSAFCGQDGRRGYIHHTAVTASAQRQGIGVKLVEHCLQALIQQGISKCHLFVMADNEIGQAFWRKHDWVERKELVMFSKDLL